MGADRSTQRSGATIGTGRDTAAWAARALAGTSLVIAGPRGSGRSHLLRALAVEIGRRGGRTIVIRPSSALSSVAFGALDAAAHPDLAALREGSDEVAPVDAVLIVDDIELLDAASAQAVARAVASRRLVVVYALRTARPRGIAPLGDAHAAPRLLLNLWVEGLAQRIDLPELTDQDARAFVEAFPDAHLLDSATRAGLVWRADGSRALLRRLVLQATGDARAGRDPLGELRAVAPHSRLAVALDRHVEEMPPADLECLAGVGRLPRLEISVATRLFDADSVHALLARGTMSADASAERRLTANDLIAQEAGRRLGAAHVDALIDAAGRRMLAEAEEWWSPSIAVAVARRWHRLGTGSSDEMEQSPAVRGRVALAAAREANDRGDAAHARAHAARGLRAVDDPSLRLEAALASGDDVADVQNGLDAEPRRRLARFLLESEHTDLPDTADRDRACADARVQQLLAESSREGALLDWTAASATAGRAVDEPAASAAARLRALVAAGTADAFAGCWQRARARYRDAERMLDARRSPDGILARDRLAALLFILAGHQIAGADGAAVHLRLDRELAATARGGDRAAMTVAGAAAAVAFAGAGRAVESRRELASAMSRTPSVVADQAATMIELGVAEELALAGELDDARSILARLDDRGAPLLRRSRLYVQTTVLAAEGRHAEAREAARAAADITRGRAATALRIRDLFRLIVLGAADEAEVDELVQLAATSDLPLAAGAVRRATARSAAEEDLPVDELRLHALWSRGQMRNSESVIGLPRVAAPGGIPGDLTAREREIAMMADEGLTNREIAQRLFLSVRTVESHVYQARAKVGAASRRELGRMVAAGRVRDDAGDDLLPRRP